MFRGTICGHLAAKASLVQRGAVNPSVSLVADSSPYTGEPLGVPTGEMKFGIKGVAADGDAEPSAACGGCSEAEHP